MGTGLLKGFGDKIRLLRQYFILRRTKLFQTDYYLQHNQDVANRGEDPYLHYLLHGGFEGRNPSDQFHSFAYLKQNPDVERAKINPLIHYILRGKAEGRSPKAIFKEFEFLSYRKTDREILDEIQTIKTKSVNSISSLAKEISCKMRFDDHIIIICQRNYLNNNSEIDLILREESRRLIEKEISFIHFYPSITLPFSLCPDEETFLLSVIIDGMEFGNFYPDDILSALEIIQGNKLACRGLEIHHLASWHLPTLENILDISRCENRILWLHDYFLVCPQHNLLRNNKEYCHAPSMESNSCMICQYGDLRKWMIPAMHAFLRKYHVNILSPTQDKIEFWNEKFPEFRKESKVVSDIHFFN